MGPGSAAHRRTGRCCASPGKRCAASGAREQILSLHSNSNRTHGFASSRQDLPELCCIHRPQKCRGRREGRVPAGTRGPLCGNCATKFAQRHTGEAKHPAFPAQWFYGLCRALPGERCTIAPVVLRMTDARGPVRPPHHRKTWRTGSGRQDGTVLPYTGCTGRVRAAFAHGCPPCKSPSRRRRLRPPRPIPRVVTIAITPLGPGWDGSLYDNPKYG
ncbi:hypothetical protein ABIF86_003628 [Bradyrhizobium japonicum]